jgi:hypothetical protein
MWDVRGRSGKRKLQKNLNTCSVYTAFFDEIKQKDAKANVQRVTPSLGCEARQILRIMQRVVACCSCHIQGQCVVVGHFWNHYTGQVVSGGLDLMGLIFGANWVTPHHIIRTSSIFLKWPFG